MPARCIWDYVLSDSKCSAAGCQRGARYVCRPHPTDGAFCIEHRNEHRQLYLKKMAELDSRPLREGLLEKAQAAGPAAEETGWIPSMFGLPAEIRF